MTQVPCAAIAANSCLELRYDGYSRIVEVHAVGISTAGNPCMRVYQTRGGSVSNEPIGWKMMTIDKSFAMEVIAERAQTPRQGYRRGDRGMSRIISQI